MKSLLLVRHAKSDWADASLGDFDRPLNERGKKDAPKMAERLLAKKVKIDAFVASPAKRAAKTATIIAEEFGRKKDKIIFKEELYLASATVFRRIVSELNDKFETVAIFSHNEGITDYANMLTNVRVDNIPTCGIYAVRSDIKSWSEFEEAEKEFWFFDFPKKM
ncbi:MAG: histidine phosphatase family protein [Chitinophagaceae bacterium]|nr:histidine phosphatase family protein [Chitinophagaceae bacterium]